MSRTQSCRIIFIYNIYFTLPTKDETCWMLLRWFVGLLLLFFVYHPWLFVYFPLLIGDLQMKMICCVKLMVEIVKDNL